MIFSRALAAWLGVALLLLSSGCSSRHDAAPGEEGNAPPPPNVGAITEFQSCSVAPSRELDSREKCQIEKLAARCLPADDCLVQCLSSADGKKVGGGCEHVCFAGLHRRPPNPPGWSECVND